MKVIFLIFLLLVCSIQSAYTQHFTLSDESGTLLNGAEVVQGGPSDTLQILTWLHLSNSSENAMQVMMKKEEIHMTDNANASICWAGYCYGPEVRVSLFPLLLPPGDTVEGCFGHFAPYGTRGVSTIRWTFFNQADPDDSISVTVHYSLFPTAVSDPATPQGNLTFTGPIPADDHVTVKYQIPPGTTGQIVMRNSNGTICAVSRLEATTGTVAINTSSMPAGFFYCTLVAGGMTVMTRKLVVCH